MWNFILLRIAFLCSCHFFALFDFVSFSQILWKYVNLPKYAVMHKEKKNLIFFPILLLLHGKLCCGAVKIAAPALGSFCFYWRGSVRFSRIRIQVKDLKCNGSGFKFNWYKWYVNVIYLLTCFFVSFFYLFSNIQIWNPDPVIKNCGYGSWSTY